MHSQMLNRARLSLVLRPVTPLLIKSGDKGAALLHPERPKLMFVRTMRPDIGETVYLPGASLKGVVRAAAERVLRSLKESLACDPLNQRNQCQEALRKRGDELSQASGGPERMAEIYKKSCLACRTFGSQSLGARALFADAYPTDKVASQTNSVEVRNSVAISRQTGGPAGGMLLDYEVVTAGAFQAEIHIANFELWQLGLLGMVLQDVQEGFVRLGSSKSRGLGRVSVEVSEVLIEQKTADNGPGLHGAGPLASPRWREAYGLRSQDSLPSSVPVQVAPLGQRLRYQGNSAPQLLETILTGPWQAFCAEAVQ